MSRNRMERCEEIGRSIVNFLYDVGWLAGDNCSSAHNTLDAPKHPQRLQTLPNPAASPPPPARGLFGLARARPIVLDHIGLAGISSHQMHTAQAMTLLYLSFVFSFRSLPSLMETSLITIIQQLLSPSLRR